jgi:hypothetical protein
MASRRTWFWIIGGIFAAGLVVLVAVAAAGIYYVSNHVQSKHSSSVDAVRAFEDVRTSFGNSTPLFEVGPSEQPTPTRPLDSLPSAAHRPRNLWVLVWNPDQERMIKLSLPFWMLRLGKQKFNVAHGRAGVDLERLELDFSELERIGPAVVFDYREPDGARVLLWTQ